MITRRAVPRLNASAPVQATGAPWVLPPDLQEDEMRRRAKLIAGAAVAAAVAGTAGVAAASGDDDAAEGPDTAITGDALQRAEDAALAETGGGRVTGTEVGDEESYYEVEVTLDDGRQVDVQLDESFAVVGTDADVEDDGKGGD
jgi:hypothetical protein